MAGDSDDSKVLAADPKLSTEVILGERFRIVHDSPIRELNISGAKAYAAGDMKNASRQLFARVCEPDVTPRVDAMVQLKNLSEARVFHPIEWGPTYWPPNKRRNFVVVFDRPEKPPLMRSLSDQIQPMHSEDIIRLILSPAAQTLHFMAGRGQLHRAIRPDNMYFGADEESGVVLGDCVTSPPGWEQPPLLEPMEMAILEPWCKGPGSSSDDFYALGATVLFLSIGRCPVAGMKPSEILAAKAQHGSFNALLNGARPPIGLRDPLRGLLSDDPAERWNADDIDQFLGGTQRRSVSVSVEARADRAFEFEGGQYRNCRSLAHAFGKHWQAAGKAVVTEDFQKWIGRTIEDAELSEELSGLISMMSVTSDGYDGGRNVAMLCLMLDPLGPLRYKGLIINPDGLGGLLARAVQKDDKAQIKVIAECIAEGLPVDWFGFRERNLRMDYTLVVKLFKRLQQMLKHTGPGYGIERCLYELQPFLPCCSKMLEGSFAYSLPDLLPALESVVRRKGGLPILVDRHVASFLAARTKGQHERDFGVLEDGRGTTIVAKLGMVKLLAIVQKEYGPLMATELTKWLAKELEPATDQFQSRSMREEIKRKLTSIGETGKLSNLYMHLSDPQALRRDQSRRTAAQREFSNAAAQIAKMESEHYHEEARRTGWRIASGISSFIAVSTIATLFMW